MRPRIDTPYRGENASFRPSPSTPECLICAPTAEDHANDRARTNGGYTRQEAGLHLVGRRANRCFDPRIDCIDIHTPGVEMPLYEGASCSEPSRSGLPTITTGSVTSACAGCVTALPCGNSRTASCVTQTIVCVLMGRLRRCGCQPARPSRRARCGWPRCRGAWRR